MTLSEFLKERHLLDIFLKKFDPQYHLKNKDPEINIVSIKNAFDLENSEDTWKLISHNFLIQMENPDKDMDILFENGVLTIFSGSTNEAKINYFPTFKEIKTEYKFPHYFKTATLAKDSKYVDIQRDKVSVTMDVYQVLKMFNVDDPAIQHAVKKLLAAGERGYKNKKKDIEEAIDTLHRALELNENETDDYILASVKQ